MLWEFIYTKSVFSPTFPSCNVLQNEQLHCVVLYITKTSHPILPNGFAMWKSDNGDYSYMLYLTSKVRCGFCVKYPKHIANLSTQKDGYTFGESKSMFLCLIVKPSFNVMFFIKKEETKKGDIIT